MNDMIANQEAINGLNGYTNEVGEYTINGVLPGRYKLIVMDDRGFGIPDF